MRSCRRSASRVLFLLLVALMVSALPVQPRAAVRDLIWKATRTERVVYLVGSVHMLTTDYYPLSPALESAFGTSDLLVEEVDFGEMISPGSQMLMLTRGMLPANQSLDTVLSPAAWTLATAHIGELGLPAEPLKRFKPWLLAMTLLSMEWEKAGFDAELGLDKHFYDRAQLEGKAVRGLETTEYQIARFDELPMSQQEKLLTDTLNGLNSEMRSVHELADAWKAGDAPAVERIVLQDLRDDPQMYQRLLVERNRNWLPQVEALLARRGSAFVVVGAAHLVGPDGLLAMLEARGFAVEQL